jgi:energy-coupling factor transport system permease protein
MLMNEIMQYSSKTGYLHSIHPLIKIIGIAAIVSLSILVTDIVLLLGLLAIICAIAVTSSLHREIMRQVPLLVFLSATLILLTVVTFQSGDVIGYLIPEGLVSPAAYMPVSMGAVEFAVMLSLRFVIILFAFQFLVITTQPTEFLKTLKFLRLPLDYVLMFLIALRFIPSLQMEGQRIHEAQLSRGYNPGKGVMGKVRSVKPVLVPLVANSLAKTQVLGLTMDFRGYRSPQKGPVQRTPLTRIDVIAGATICLICATFLMALVS